MNQFRTAHGVVSSNNHIHVIGGSASASDVACFGIGLKGLEVLCIEENGENEVNNTETFCSTDKDVENVRYCS